MAKCVKNKAGVVHTVNDDHWSLKDDDYKVVPCPKQDTKKGGKQDTKKEE